MKNLLIILMGVSLIPAVVAGFGTGTTKKIDTVQNNTEANIVLSPATSVIIDSLTGNFVLQSSGTKEIQESAVTNTELGYLSGATSSVQTQIDSKEPTLPWTTDGDIVKYNGTVASRIAIGAIGTVFSVNAGGLPTWAAPLTQSPTITRGDLIMNISSTAGGDVALPIGTDPQVLTSNGDIASWQDAASASPTTTLGDVILRGAAEDERLAIGTANQLLTANGTTATWEDAPVSTTLTTKGDIQIFSTENARLPVGPDGSFIVADSTEALGVKYSTSLQGTLNPVSDWELVVCDSSWTSNSTHTCYMKRTGDTLTVRVKINLTGTPTGTQLILNVPIGLTIDTTKLNNSTQLRSTVVGKGMVTNESSGSGRFNITAFYNSTTSISTYVSNATSTILYTADAVTATTPINPLVSLDVVEVEYSVPIVGWSSGLDGVIQAKTLDATTANELSAKIANNGTATLTSFNYDFIGTVTRSSQSVVDVVYKTGIFTQAPSVVATVSNESSRNLSITTSTLTGFSINTRGLGNQLTDQDFDITVSKQGVDVNKNVIQVATIKGIEDRCQTKFLSSDVSTDGVISDLAFSNLTIGKLYSIKGVAAFDNLAVNDAVELIVNHDGGVVAKAVATGNGSAGATFHQSISGVDFTATATTLITTANSLTSPSDIRGNSTVGSTHIQLCELGNTVTTTEF